MNVDALAEGAHSFTADGITFAYTVSGTGPLLVAQSVGWGLSSMYLQNGLRPLEAYVKLLYFTPRGNGESTRPASTSAMSSKDMAYDLEHLREHLHVPSFALLGHSNGGAIALAYAERFPSCVTKLILVDHELQTFSCDNWKTFAAARKDHPVYGPALQQLMSMMMNVPSTDEGFSRGLLKALPYYFADTEKTRIEVEDMGTAPISVWAFASQSTADRGTPFPHVAELGNVEADTLIVFGNEDAICSVAAGERTREGIKRSKLVILEDCGHFPWVEKPDEFFKEVRGFLEG
jgi:proline iminopeptidase